MKPSTEGQLQVWWIPQVPMKAFEFDVPSPEVGKMALNWLADYDAFQFNNNIKPDYCNAGGLRVFHNGEWEDWEDSEGNSIDDTEEVKI